MLLVRLIGTSQRHKFLSCRHDTFLKDLPRCGICAVNNNPGSSVERCPQGPRLWTSHAEKVDLSAKVEEVCRDMRFFISNKIPADIHSFLVQGDLSRTVFGGREPSIVVRMTMGEGTSGLRSCHLLTELREHSQTGKWC